MTLQETLRALTPDEKLAIVTQLWDDLAASASLTLPDDELAEMNRRRDELPPIETIVSTAPCSIRVASHELHGRTGVVFIGLHASLPPVPRESYCSVA